MQVDHPAQPAVLPLQAAAQAPVAAPPPRSGGGAASGGGGGGGGGSVDGFGGRRIRGDVSASTGGTDAVVVGGGGRRQARLPILEADETMADVLGPGRDTRLVTGLALFDQCDGGLGLRGGDLVQLRGAQGCGKSEILLHIIAQCITPTECGGLQATAVYIDMHRTLSVHRLASLVHTRLLKGNAIPARATEAFPVHAAVLESLDRLHIVRPSNSFQLLMTLHALDEGTVGDLGLARVVVIDSVGACYWSDKAWQPGAGKSQAAHIAYASQRLAERHAVTVFCAKPKLFAKTSADYHTVWNRVATHHVDLMSVTAGHTAAAAVSAAASVAAADAGPPSTSGWDDRGIITKVRASIQRAAGRGSSNHHGATSKKESYQLVIDGNGVRSLAVNPASGGAAAL